MLLFGASGPRRFGLSLIRRRNFDTTVEPVIAQKFKPSRWIRAADLNRKLCRADRPAEISSLGLANQLTLWVSQHLGSATVDSLAAALIRSFWR